MKITNIWKKSWVFTKIHVANLVTSENHGFHHMLSPLGPPSRSERITKKGELLRCHEHHLKGSFHDRFPHGLLQPFGGWDFFVGWSKQPQKNSRSKIKCLKRWELSKNWIQMFFEEMGFGGSNDDWESVESENVFEWYPLGLDIW